MYDLPTLDRLLKPLLPGLMGLQLTELRPDFVAASLPVREDLCTTGHMLHGGSIMAFADTLGAVGTVLNLPPGASTTTTNSATQFIAGAPAGSTVRGECRALHRGRRTMVWQTHVLREDGALCAVITQTQLVLPATQPAAAAPGASG